MSRLHEFVNVPSRTVGRLADPAPSGNTPTFVTMQSLVTFPVAAFIVGALWLAVRLLQLPNATSAWYPFGFAMLVGAIVYVVTITDPKVALDNRDKLIGIPIAFFNAIVLFTAALGGTNAAGGGSPSK